MIHLSPSLISSGDCTLSQESAALASMLLGQTHELSAESLYTYLQQRFFLPYEGQFRFAIPDDGGGLASELELAFSALGLIDPLEPAAHTYDYCIVPGAVFSVSANAICSLLQQAAALQVTFSNLLFLGSDRLLMATELWQLKQLDAGLFIEKRPQTETDMLQFLWHSAETLVTKRETAYPGDLQGALSRIRGSAQVDFVHCQPKADAPHATTSDAVQALAAKIGYSSFEDSRILVASVQPFARYHLCVLLNHCCRAGVRPKCIHAAGAAGVKSELGLERMANNLAKLLFEEREYFSLCGKG